MSQAQGLDTPVRYLRGVGPKRSNDFLKLGINTVRDLLEFFPRRYRFFDQVGSISDLREGQEASVIGCIESVDYKSFPYPPRVNVTIWDESGGCFIRWFHGGFLLDRLRVGSWIRVQGKVRSWRSEPAFSNPKFEILEDRPTQPGGNLSLPVYPSQEQFGSKFLTDLIRLALEQYGDDIKDWFSGDWLAQRDLIDRRDAYKLIHEPEDEGHWQQARKRLAYDELFFMQLGVMLARRIRQGRSTVRLASSDEMDRRIRRRFPFRLTGAQNRVIGEILSDMSSPRQMSRLIQGDVGCGKTVVALYAALVAVANRYQAAIMAPTEILAQQHYRKISEYLSGSKVRMALLVGGTSQRDRREIIEQASSGELDILIGTHALIEKDVTFANLALVVIDEQHKFGVHQRAAIRSKGAQPHYLVMTATPIPRSLALTVFGDLDLSVIDELPPGKLPVKTRLFNYTREKEVWEFLSARLRDGDQAYVVYPLLEQSDQLALRSARSEARRLAEHELSEFRVGLVHGRMKSDEKQRIMTDFRQGKLDVLVATVVIEVGIDMPEANVLVVEHADRFGLAQLHQLRGRIGRSGGQGHCLLLANARTEPARKRLEVLLETADGFKIAEEDLRMRGPGQFFGTAQHGLPELKLADLVEDYQLLVQARMDAQDLLYRDPDLRQHRHCCIREELIRRLAGKLELIEAA